MSQPAVAVAVAVASPSVVNKNILSFLPIPTPHYSYLSPLSALPPTNRLRSLSSKNPLFVTSYTTEKEEEEVEIEEQVIGDCLIFEEGIFEDPFLQDEPHPLPLSPISTTTTTTSKKHNKGNINININININNRGAQYQKAPEENLVPEEWSLVVEQLNLTKKERRKIAKEMEFGTKILKRERVRKAAFLEDYLKNRKDNNNNSKPPVVVDSLPRYINRPSQQQNEYDGGDNDDDNDFSSVTNERVEPVNPRWNVYGRGLDDIDDFFNSENYQPDAEKKPEGERQKLFTKEEKTLLNARTPKLAVATSQKWLPLHALASCGEFYLVIDMLKHGVDVNAADQDGLTALHKAIICKKQAVTDCLLRESADPFVRDKDGATLMHYAVRTASSLAIKTLLLQNVDINLQDNDGWTPLHLAVQSRRTDVVRLLLMKGADKTLRNQDGLTPLELCLYSGQDAKTYELIRLLKQLPRRRR